MHRLGRLLLSLIFILASTGLARADGAVNLKLIHLNDSHSHLEAVPFSLKLAGETTYVDLGGMARLKTKIDQLRRSDSPLLLLHAGDLVQGTLYYTEYGGKPEMEIMNLLRPAAMTLGNHEFDRGATALAALLGRAEFPILSANTDSSNQPEMAGRYQPYVVVRVGPADIGIIGLTTPETADASEGGKEFTFFDPALIARKYVKILTDRGINKIVVLSHLGYTRDLVLAKNVAGLDLIIGGHSHTEINNPITDGQIGLEPDGDYPTWLTGPEGDPVYVTQAWCYTQALGLLDVSFSDSGRVEKATGEAVHLLGDNFERLDAQGNQVPVGSAERAEIMNFIAANPVVEVAAESADVLALLAPYKQGLEDLRKQVVGKAAETLYHIRIPGRTETGVDLPHGSQVGFSTCQSMIDTVNAAGENVTLALRNAGSIRGDIAVGEITVGDVYELLPFENSLVIRELTGAELVAAVEEGVVLAVTGHGGSFPYPAGFRYTADLNLPPGGRISSLEVKDGDGWTPVDPGATYRLVLLSFTDQGGDGYTVFNNSTGYRYDTGFQEADAFLDYVKKIGTLTRPESTGVTYIPLNGGGDSGR